MSISIKRVSVVVAMLLCVSLLLSGCGATEPASSPAPSSSEVSQPAGPPAYGTWEERQQAFQDPNGRLMVCAHRGFWSGEQPENSIAALNAAFELGVDIIEIDIKVTADGEYILCHDDSLVRTTNVVKAWTDGTVTGDMWSYKVSDLTLDQIKCLSLKAGDGGNDAALTDEKIPTLREAIEACRNKVYLLLDGGANYMEDICAIIDELDAWDYCMFQMGGSSSSVQMTLREYEQKYGKKPLTGWFFIRDTPKQIAADASWALSKDPTKNMPWVYVHPNNGVSWNALQADINNIQHAMDPTMMAALKGKARLFLNTLDSWANGVDCVAYWEQLYNAGYNIIQTDKPQELVVYIRSLLGVDAPQIN